jgi:hypothetical protein
MALHKELHYLPSGQTIRFNVSFNKDKFNYATSQPLKIGYRIVATPVTIEKHPTHTIESSMAFSGFGDTLLEVERQSKKRLEQAIAILAERKEEYLDFFKNKGL